MANVNKIRIIRDGETIDYDIMGSGGEVLPVGTIVDYDGEEVPAGYEEVSDPNVYSTEEKVIGKWIDRETYLQKSIR